MAARRLVPAAHKEYTQGAVTRAIREINPRHEVPKNGLIGNSHDHLVDVYHHAEHHVGKIISHGVDDIKKI
jgi:hypothetical protein